VTGLTEGVTAAPAPAPAAAAWVAAGWAPEAGCAATP